jgi:predicted Zn-dependent protease
VKVDGTKLQWQINDLSFEQHGNLLRIRNLKLNGFVIDIMDLAFSKRLFSIIKNNKTVYGKTIFQTLGPVRISILAVGILTLLITAYFFVLPYIAEKSVPLLPDSFDNYIGDSFLETFMNENDIDSTKTKYLEDFVAALDLNNTKPIKVSVVESEEINAFALPNGQIVVYTGILKNMKKPDELAGLLAHEAAHINSRHATKMLCRNMTSYIILALLFRDNNSIMSVVADNAQALQSLSYSRKFEEEADEQGLSILMSNQLDPNGMVKLFEQLEAEEESILPEIISSHPLTADRKNNIQKLILQKTYQVKTNRRLQTLFEQLVEE